MRCGFQASIHSGMLAVTVPVETTAHPLRIAGTRWRERIDRASSALPANRDLEQPITRVLFPELTDVVVHDERGRVSCVCPATGEIRAMAFQGFEAGRGPSGTIAYRCPAAAFDLDCKGRGACHRAGGVKPGANGRIVRVDLDKHDRRIFTPTPWGSPSWRRGYNRRSAMERIDARLDRGFNFETHYIRGLARMKTRVGLALAAMMAMARAPAAPSGCAPWSARCRTATPADRSAAFRQRRSDRPDAGTPNPSAGRR